MGQRVHDMCDGGWSSLEDHCARPLLPAECRLCWDGPLCGSLTLVRWPRHPVTLAVDVSASHVHATETRPRARKHCKAASVGAFGIGVGVVSPGPGMASRALLVGPPPSKGPRPP